ncbi:hypothetical protein [Arthrobacter sp. DR-2P]|nr:hypothetical protein [Arthrobacter sp. DR-2P]
MLFKHGGAGVTAKLYCLTSVFSGPPLNKKELIGESIECDSKKAFLRCSVERRISQ